MPRANRYIVSGPSYHITHRCHDRAFLLQYAKHRNAYRNVLRDRLKKQVDVSLLAYCITSNHVHLLLTNRGDDDTISRFMQAVQGQFAQNYNHCESRSGAFWSDRFHATMIDSGEYLWQCMRYIDLNMVRAGVVDHPSKWEWCGYSEITGLRKRYRLLDLDRLCERTSQPDTGALGQWYQDWIDDASLAETKTRDDRWTDRIAVGRRDFVERIGRQVENRMSVEVADDGDGSWSIREKRPSYSPS